MDAFLAFVENSALSEWVRGSDRICAFPTIVTLHNIGMAFLAGGKCDSPSDWKCRFKENTDKMQTGSLLQVAEVLKIQVMTAVKGKIDRSVPPKRVFRNLDLF